MSWGLEFRNWQNQDFFDLRQRQINIIQSLYALENIILSTFFLIHRKGSCRSNNNENLSILNFIKCVQSILFLGMKEGLNNNLGSDILSPWYLYGRLQKVSYKVLLILLEIICQSLNFRLRSQRISVDSWNIHKTL